VEKMSIHLVPHKLEEESRRGNREASRVQKARMKHDTELQAVKRGRIVLRSSYHGDTLVAVHRPGAKSPHFYISGACVEDLDFEKVAAYMYGCDWADRGAKGYTTPELKCDDFLLEKSDGRET